MIRWQYMTIDLGARTRKESEVDLLNRAGEQGWELVGITPPLTAWMRRPQESAAPRSASFEVEPKYRDPDTGETWSGRGRMARWLAARVAAGHSVDEFLVSES